MIEILEKENIENYEMEYPYHLLKDGKIIENVGAREIEVWNDNLGDMEKSFEVEAFDDSSKLIGEFKIEEFSESSKLCLYGWCYFEDFQVNAFIFLNHGFEKFFIDFQLIPNFSFWKRNYSFVEYRELFLNILLEKFAEWEILVSLNDDGYKEFTDIKLTFSHKFENKIINQELSRYEKALEKIHTETIETLNQANYKNSIKTLFNFPNELKIPCEQYLLYFAQFLQDRGINTTSNLTEEAGKVLFSVTPTDDIEALDKIREALAVYLNLPSSPIRYDESFAAMRLQQQIENLQHSQRMKVRELQFNEKLLIAQSDTIREKNLTISHQQSIIERQNEIIEKISSKSIMTDSVENKEELEEVYEGLKIGKSKFLMEQLGLHINPVTFLRNLGKSLLGKNENKSILGLDDIQEEMQNAKTTNANELKSEILNDGESKRLISSETINQEVLTIQQEALKSQIEAEKNSGLSLFERVDRYKRQIILTEIGSHKSGVSVGHLMSNLKLGKSFTYKLLDELKKEGVIKVVSSKNPKIKKYALSNVEN